MGQPDCRDMYEHAALKDHGNYDVQLVEVYMPFPDPSYVWYANLSE